jgi:hypothetical protein
MGLLLCSNIFVNYLHKEIILCPDSVVNNNWLVSNNFGMISMPLEATATWNFNYEIGFLA